MSVRIVTIKVTVKDGKIKVDFDGFPDQACSREEDAIRAFAAMLGVKTEIIDEEVKPDGQKTVITEKQRQRN